MKHIFSLFAFVLLISEVAWALPFNEDMVGKQLIVGRVMRAKPAGSIAVGTLDRHIEKREDTLTWENPMKNDPQSARRGERVFAVNCSPCHGNYNTGAWQPSAILSKGMPSMDLSSEAIRTDPQTGKFKPDGHYFGYAYVGGIVMPSYGWKLSQNELWDVVSYIRKLQGLNGK